MAKITLSPITGSYASVTAINARFQQIEDAFNDDVLWRDGFTGEPNSMAKDLDMAGFDILNASTIELTNEVSYAAEWANKAEDSLISAAAGGDEVDDYSSLHHSAKANDQRVLAETAKAASETAQTAAELAETNAAASYDSFDDRYLGPKASAPTLDNDGNTLLTGAMYFNNVSNDMWVWNGSAWGLIGTTQNSAASVTIADSGGFYDTANVETAFQEIRDTPKIRARLTGLTVSIASGSTPSIIPFDAEDFDTKGEFVLGASGRFTPTEEGYYSISLSVGMTATWSAGNSVTAHIYRNTGDTCVSTEKIEVAGIQLITADCHTIYYLNGTTDYVELKATQDSGGTINFFGGSLGRYDHVDIFRITLRNSLNLLGINTLEEM